MKSYWSQVAPWSNITGITGVLIIKGTLNTDINTGRLPVEDKSKNQGDASTSQRTLKIANKPPEAKQ